MNLIKSWFSAYLNAVEPIIKALELAIKLAVHLLIAAVALLPFILGAAFQIIITAFAGGRERLDEFVEQE